MKILMIIGHPDPDKLRFNYQLAQAYKTSALESGFQVKEICVADLQFELLREEQDYNSGTINVDIKKCQELILWADHILLFYPLWLGGMPALLKGFLEQVLRPGFAYDLLNERLPKKLLKGKSFHIFITMGMPALIYRYFFFAHSVKSLKRNILSFCGFKPIRSTLIGSIGSKNSRNRLSWLKRLKKLGSKGL